MAKIRGRDTLPEIVVRKRLFACGWRFRVCDKRYPGKPDVVLPKARAIIDVRGCFWHRHGCRDATMPKTNVEFWTAKWARNVERDRRNEEAWLGGGWNLVVVWQCALAGAETERTLARISAALKEWAEERAGGRAPRTPHRIEFPFPVSVNRAQDAPSQDLL